MLINKFLIIGSLGFVEYGCGASRPRSRRC